MDVRTMEPGNFEVPTLFQLFESHSHPRAHREYVQSELIRLARAGELVLTHLLIQRPPVCHLAVDVLIGQGISDGSDGHLKEHFHTDWEIPSELEGLTVVVASITGGPIEYLDGYEELKGTVKAAGLASHRIGRRRERVRRVKGPVAELPIRSAIIALQQGGVMVKYGVSGDMRVRHWKVAEVHPALPWFDEFREQYQELRPSESVEERGLASADADGTEQPAGRPRRGARG